MGAVTRNELLDLKRTKTISITSGKGGVGKTTLVVNLAAQMAKTGKKVLILDGDLGMANVDVMFGVKTRYHLKDCVTGVKRLDEVIHKIDDHISIIPGGSGIFEVQSLTEFEKRNFMDQLKTIGNQYDYMLIDTAPGIDSNVVYFNTCAQSIVVVVTPDPASLTDAYALIKILVTKYHEKHFSIIANNVRDEQEGLTVYNRLADVSQRFLNVGLDYLGPLPYDILIRRAVRSQQLFATTMPDSSSVSCIKKIIDKIGASQNSGQSKGGLQFFWENLMGVA